MVKGRFLRWCVIFVAAEIAVGHARAADDGKKNPPEEKQQRLIGLLQSDTPPQDKATACKQLAVCGTKDAVPALEALLADEKLASWARIALEAIPGSAADDALREAMGAMQGKLLVGVINSIGVRRDAKAVDGLVQRLTDGDAEVVAAAAVALGASAVARPPARWNDPLPTPRPPLARHWRRAAFCAPNDFLPTAIATRRPGCTTRCAQRTYPSRGFSKRPAGPFSPGTRAASPC